MTNDRIQPMGKDAYQAAIKRAVLYGARSRLAGKLSGETLRIGFLGGSITYGYQSDGSTLSCPYPDLLGRKLRKIFPDKTITICNLGYSGTDCILGAVAAETVLRDFAPDIVFLEYAVNEETSKTGIAKFESLIRKLICFKNAPAVIPIALFAENGYSCEEFMLAVSRHYGLDFCAMRTGFLRYFTCGLLRWADYSGDGVHPSSAGHEMIAECLFFLLKNARTLPADGVASVLFSAQFERIKPVPFDKMQISGFRSIEFPCYCFRDALETLPDTAVRTVSFCLTAKTCSVIYYSFNDQTSAGSAQVLVDHKEICTLDAYSTYGWGNPIEKLILNDRIAAKHEITLRVSGLKRYFVIAAIAADDC